MAKSNALSPQALRGTLVLVLILIIAGGAGLFYMGLNEVRRFAIEVNHTVMDAEASGGNIQKLQTLRTQLAQSESLVAKANQMFAAPDNYQSQASNDVRNYANATGLTITKTVFDDATHTMIVNFKNPISYTKFIEFLDGVEGNIPKMQVTSASISHVAGGRADSVAVNEIKIMIATR